MVLSRFQRLKQSLTSGTKKLGNAIVRKTKQIAKSSVKAVKNTFLRAKNIFRRQPPPRPPTPPPEIQLEDEVDDIINADIYNDIVDLKNRKLNYVEFDLSRITFKEFLDTAIEILGYDREIAIEAGDVVKPFSERVIKMLYNIDLLTGEPESLDTYEELVYNSFITKKIALVRYTTENREYWDRISERNRLRQDADGGWFKYYNKTDLDLSKIGIYTEEQINKQEGCKYKIFDDNCLYIALKEGGLEGNKLRRLKTLIKTRDVPTNRLELICKKLNISIEIKKVRNTDNGIYSNPRKTIYGDNKKYKRLNVSNTKKKDANFFKINLIDGHYFIDCNFEVTSFYIKYYGKYNLKNIIEGKRIIKKQSRSKDKPIHELSSIDFERTNKPSLSSYRLVLELLKNKSEVLEPIKLNKLLMNSQFYDKVDDFEDLSFNPTECLKPVQTKKDKLYDDLHYFFTKPCYTDYEKDKKDRRIQEIDYELETGKKIKSHIRTENSSEEELTEIYAKICEEVKKIDQLYNNLTNKNIKEELKSQRIMAVHKINEIQKGIDIWKNNNITIKEKREHNDVINMFKIMNEYINVLKEIMYFDFETFTNLLNHNINYTCSIIGEKDDRKDVKSYDGEDCALQLINNLPAKDITLIAHNVKFDFYCIFSSLTKFVSVLDDNKLISAEAVHYKNGKSYRIRFIDSYKIFPTTLYNLGKSQQVDIEKEVMPYSLYNVYMPKKQKHVNLEIFLQYVKDAYKTDEAVEQARENIYKWDCLNGSNVDIVNYSKKYCNIDVIVLRDSMVSFKKRMTKITEGLVDMDSIMTISSLSNQYFRNKGCFDGCYEITGIPRLFIQRCVIGGRCMTNSNQMYHVKQTIADMDCNSQYPSSVVEGGGCPKGVLKTITTEEELSYDFLKNTTQYYVYCKVLKVGIKRDFPLLKKNEDGVLKFTNDMVGEYIYIDKNGLEDAIQFQDIEVEIIKGYYFNEGRNSLIVDVIKKLYAERQILKDRGSPEEKCIKLILNSIYGKFLQKDHEKSTQIILKKNKNEYLYKYYNYIDEIRDVGDYCFVKKYKVDDDHYNMNYYGVDILSMSKRIMNRPMCLAEDNGFMMLYQDTDSMHILDKHVDDLSDLYKEKYNKQLFGRGLGRFTIDYKIKGAISETIRAVESYYLGKKVYYCKTEGKNDKGEILQGEHITLKGVKPEAIPYEANKLNTDILGLFKNMYDNRGHIFDVSCGGSKPSFRYDKNENGLIHYQQLTDLDRQLKFNGIKNSI